MGGGNAVLVLCFIILIISMLLLIAIADEVVRKGTICGRECQFLQRFKKVNDSRPTGHRNPSASSNGSTHNEESRPLVDFKGLFRQFSQASLSQMSSNNANSDGSQSEFDEQHLKAPRHNCSRNLSRPRSDSLQLASTKLVHLKTCHAAVQQAKTSENKDFTIILTPPQSDTIEST